MSTISTQNTQKLNAPKSASSSSTGKISLGKLKAKVQQGLEGTNGTSGAALSMSNPNFGSRNGNAAASLNFKSFLG